MIMDYRISYKTLVASLMLATLVSAPVSGPLMAQEAGPSPMANLVIQVQELQDAFPDCWTANDGVQVLLDILFPRQASDVWPIS